MEANWRLESMKGTYLVEKENDDSDLGGFTIGQWKIKRQILNSNLDYSEEWEEAFNWYHRRLNSRYFFPLKKIEAKISGAGFTFVTVQCVLIEHFASMITGKIHNHKCNNQSPDYEYRISSEHFKKFLETSVIFSSYFSSPNYEKPEFDSKDFYDNVRCALLHEACTKNNWRINTLSCGYPNPDRRIFLNEKSNIKRIFRDVLNEQLESFVLQYKEDLKHDKLKRLYFARKIDHLCSIKPNAAEFEWWEDK